MRILAIPLILFLGIQAALAEDIVIAFPVKASPTEGKEAVAVLGFKVISTDSAKASKVTASESALTAISNLKIELGGKLDPAVENFNADLNTYGAETVLGVTEYFVQLPLKIPGDNEYPGGGGGWWPPRVIWPTPELPNASIPKPWPGGGGGWWPPRAAMSADQAENDLLRSIYINTYALTKPLNALNDQLIIAE